MLVTKSIIDGSIVALNNKLGEMIGHDILSPRLVLHLLIELLVQQNPPNKVRFRIFLLKEVLEYRVVGVHGDLRA